MYSVSSRAEKYKQPRGGFISIREFSETNFSDCKTLNQNENIHAGLIGMAVDYLFRYSTGGSLEECFEVSLMGADLVQDSKKAEKLLTSITGLDDESILSACKLVGYDVCFRVGVQRYKPIEYINPDIDTIHNIRTMVQRCIAFIVLRGPIAIDGFTFQNAYTNIVSTGDGDFITKDTLWDLKTSVRKPTTRDTLQILMYYLMGLKSIHKEFDNITRIGIFNPRLNTEFLMNIKDINQSVIKEVNSEVIGYK